MISFVCDFQCICVAVRVVEGQYSPEYQAISDLMVVSKLVPTKTCPECIKGDYHDSMVTWNFTVVMTHDCWCGEK